MSKNITKEYTNGEVTVIWDSQKCFHSANCVKNLKNVFNPRQRPWINMDGAATDKIIAAVKTCPSGAISFKMNDAVEDSGGNQDLQNSATDIQLLPNGPLMVTGSFEIKDSEGNVLACKEKVALCRCGASENKPFCDGKHRKVGFTG